jgi:hypothetical protein
MVTTPEFAEYEKELIETLHEESRKAMAQQVPSGSAA